jgi:pimeloyl-ACP methyl ester carboxylesterase
MPYAAVGDERIFYTYHRSQMESAPHLLLVHGAGGSHQHWGRAIRILPEAHVYTLDLPGHGRSGGTGRRTVPDYAAFLIHFMDTLALKRSVIVGHSMGSATALTAALTYPQRVAGLVLVGSGARLRVLPQILEGTLSDLTQTVGLICSYAYSSQTPAELVQRGLEQMAEVPPQTIHDDFAACDTFDVMPRLGEIHCPTLVICGTEDKLTPPKYATFLTERIAGAELKLIEGAGHMVMVEQPELVAEAISAALARWRLGDH